VNRMPKVDLPTETSVVSELIFAKIFH